MTKSKHLGDLLVMVEMRYSAQNRAFQEIVAEEMKIRSELNRISAQDRAADTSQVSEMRSIGADVMWKAWLGRTKRALNTRLAQVLAKKEHHLRQVKRAYGKVLVTRELLENQAKLEITKIDKERLGIAVSQSFTSKRKPQ